MAFPSNPYESIIANIHEEAYLRISIGTLPEEFSDPKEESDWKKISGPNARVSFVLAGIAGLLLLGLLWIGLSFVSINQSLGSDVATISDSPMPWWVVILVLILYIPVHELFHGVFHPGCGRTDRSILMIWPRKIRFGMYFEGCMSRKRWLIMRAAPLIFLSLVPTVVLAIANLVVILDELAIGLQVLILVNSIGSGGDLVALGTVMRQVPRAADICFSGGKAYWKPSGGSLKSLKPI